MHGSMRRREATTASRASTSRAAEDASRRPYNVDSDITLGIGRTGLRDKPWEATGNGDALVSEDPRSVWGGGAGGAVRLARFVSVSEPGRSEGGIGSPGRPPERRSFAPVTRSYHWPSFRPGAASDRTDGGRRRSSAVLPPSGARPIMDPVRAEGNTEVWANHHRRASERLRGAITARGICRAPPTRRRTDAHGS